MPRFLLLVLVVAALLPCLAQPAAAATERFRVTHSYHLGDSESRNEARVKCLAEAKRRLAEEAGVLVDIRSRTELFQLAEDEVQSFSLAVLRIRVEDEVFAVRDGAQVLTLTVSAEADLAQVRTQLEAMLERRLARLEADLDAAPAALEPDAAGAESPAVAPAAAPRSMTVPPPAPLAPLLSEEENTRRSAALLAKGQSRADVERLLGPPQGTKSAASPRYLGYRYGRNWVIFRDDAVLCLRKRLEYDPRTGDELHCAGLASSFVLR